MAKILLAEIQTNLVFCTAVITLITLLYCDVLRTSGRREEYLKRADIPHFTTCHSVVT